LVELPVGKRNYPLHAHAAQWEHFIILSGTGWMHRDGSESIPLGAGDHVVCPPGEAHQIENASATQSLCYYVISDHHPADVTIYPRTGKRQIKPEYRVVRVEEVGYYDGEE
jgi:uncharacterized cupin superfamily protein